MKKFPEVVKIIKLFIVWRIVLIILSILAINFIPLAGENFLGGGFKNYLRNPYLLSWANFDGEHYLSVAQVGYKGLEQAFFPVYPILIRFLAQPFGVNLYYLTIAGLIISNLTFLVSLIFLWKLIRIDFPKRIAWLTLLTLILFPTSFYFGAVYTESLFLLLIILSFYFGLKNNWQLAAIFGMIASATRVFGVLLLPSLLIEAWQKKEWSYKLLWLLLIPLGLGAYLYYSWLTSGDPWIFYHNQPLVGEQHQFGIIPFPQVVFRYFKILTSADMTNPIYQTVALELLTGIIFLILPIYGYFKKIRVSYLFFALASFLLPTVQGSFSSLPRYILVLFPSFLALAIWLSSLSKIERLAIQTLLFLGLAVETILFLRGYWVA